MSADELRKKSPKALAKPHTKHVKVGRFNLTSHVQNRIVERGINVECVIENLCRKPAANTKTKVGKKGPSYTRINKDTTTGINPINKNVTTIYRTNQDVAKKYRIKRSTDEEYESKCIVDYQKIKSTKRKTTKRTSNSKVKTGCCKGTKKKTVKKR